MASRTRTTEPPPLRWLIGRELARYRDATGMSMASVAQKVGITKPKLGQMETGRQYQSPTDIAVLLTFYGVDREEIDALTELTDRAEEASWASGSAHAVPSWFRIYLGLERIAERVFSFEPLMVPGLLHTESYARSVIGSSLFVRAPDIDRVVALRMSRAQRLTDAKKPLEFHLITTEAALRVRVADPDTHRAQLQHLLTMTQQPNVSVRLVRAEDGYHDAHNGKFVLLDFEKGRSLAYMETIDNALYVQDPEQVHHHTLVADQLRKLACTEDEARRVITAVAGSLS